MSTVRYSTYNRNHATRAGVVACSVGGLMLASPVGAAAAAGDGPAIVTNRETVQVDLSSSGSVDNARLFSQLVISADGKAVVLDPISGKNIRDLDGFSAPDVKLGLAKYTVDVHGNTTRRTVSDFTKKLPLRVGVEYLLDGKRMRAGDLVGKSGILEVNYTVENVSATPTSISYTVAGKPFTKTIDLVTPMVGQLTTTLPASFTDIDTPRADVAGDGRGGQTLNWTMVLFEPIGQNTQTFGYTARVKDLHLPAARIQAVPVAPNRHPELAFGEKGFYDGSASGGDVAFAGSAIDTNLAKLRDGAGQLLSGLTQLAAGATALEQGLVGEAAPGANTLSDGLGQASTGSNELRTGLTKLSAGAGQLSAGIGEANSGSSELATGADKATAGAAQLTTGLQQISAGLEQLAATTGLPAVQAGLEQLRVGIDHPVGAGGPTDPGGLLQGLQAISGGLALVASPTAGLPAAKTGVDQVAAALADASKPGGSLVKLQGAALALAPAIATAAGGPCTTPFPVPPAVPVTACQTLAALYYGIGQVSSSSAAGAGGLGQVSAGLDSAITGVRTLQAGTAAAVAGVQTSLLGGIDQLIAGVTEAVTGVTALAAGATSAAAGSAALSDGTAKLAAGAGQLDDGLVKLNAGGKAVAAGAAEASAGSDELSSGLEQLYSGSQQLADGIDAAADGSTQLADGMDKAVAGGNQLQDGAEQLRTEAAVPLATAGLATAKDYAENYAIMVALDNKVADGALPYGAPKGGTGTAAYDFTLAAQTASTQDNTTRGIAAIVLLGLAALSGYLVRRRVPSR